MFLERFSEGTTHLYYAGSDLHALVNNDMLTPVITKMLVKFIYLGIKL